MKIKYETKDSNVCLETRQEYAPNQRQIQEVSSSPLIGIALYVIKWKRTLVISIRILILLLIYGTPIMITILLILTPTQVQLIGLSTFGEHFVVQKKFGDVLEKVITILWSNQRNKIVLMEIGATLLLFLKWQKIVFMITRIVRFVLIS